MLLSKSDPTSPLVRGRGLPEQVAEQLTEMIVTGVLPPGSPLPTEAELAQRYGVSRPVVREGFRVLQTRGMVEVRQGVASVVNAVDRWDHGGLLSLLVRSDQWPLADWVEVRRILETEAAAVAARRVTEEDLRGMREALERMEADGLPPEDFVQADIAFHLRIAEAARNRPLAALMTPLLAPLQDRIAEALRWPDAKSWSRIQHRHIFAAIATGDAGAARAAMQHHLAHVAHEAERLLRESEGGADTGNGIATES